MAQAWWHENSKHRIKMQSKVYKKKYSSEVLSNINKLWKFSVLTISQFLSQLVDTFHQFYLNSKRNISILYQGGAEFGETIVWKMNLNQFQPRSILRLVGTTLHKQLLHDKLTKIKTPVNQHQGDHFPHNTKSIYFCLIFPVTYRSSGAMGRVLDLRSTGRWFKSYSGQKLHNNLGHVVHTDVLLSPSSITWYQPRGGNALRLGR